MWSRVGGTFDNSTEMLMHWMVKSKVVMSVIEAGLVVRRRSHGGVERVRWRRQNSLRWWALVALSKEPKCVNLVYEISHARPPAKSKPNNKHPHYYKHIDRVRPYPSSHKLWWLLHSILHDHITAIHQKNSTYSLTIVYDLNILWH